MTTPTMPLFDLDPQIDDLVLRIERGGPESDDADKALTEYVAGLTLDNPDLIAEYIAHYEAHAEVKNAWANQVKKELTRALESSALDQIRADRIAKIALETLKNAHRDFIAGDKFTLKRKQNGGRQGLNAHSPGLIPDVYHNYKLPPLDYSRIQELREVLRESLKGRSLLPFVETATREPRNDVIKTALENGAEIPGVNLHPRGERIEIR